MLRVSTSTDEAQLLELQARYASTYDDRLPEQFAEVFTEDGRLVLPDGQVLAGRRALADFAAAAASRPFRTYHFMTNQVIETRGDTASGAAHVTAVSRKDDDVRLLIIGRYDDTMVRTQNGWQLAERVISALPASDLATHP